MKFLFFTFLLTFIGNLRSFERIETTFYLSVIIDLENEDSHSVLFFLFQTILMSPFINKCSNVCHLCTIIIGDKSLFIPEKSEKKKVNK